MKILNLYAGIGGNRKLWGDEHEVTAVESEQYIADAYQKLYPNDTVIVGDAHQYLLDHYKEFDFIWSSPPCPSHSRLNNALNPQGYVRYPDMTLYQEVIFLQSWYKGNWVIENVIPYYKPLVQPVVELDRHLFWSNRHIPHKKSERTFDVSRAEHAELSQGLGIDVSFMERKHRRKVLRNAVMPELGLHIFNAVGLQMSETVPGENLTLALASSEALTRDSIREPQD